MTRLSGAAVLGVFLSWSVALHAQDKDPIKEKLDKAKTVYEAERTKLREGLLMNLQKKEKTAREAGDKKLVDQVVAEQEKFESDGVMPTVIPTTEYQRQVRQSFRSRFLAGVCEDCQIKPDLGVGFTAEQVKGGALDARTKVQDVVFAHILCRDADIFIGSQIWHQDGSLSEAVVIQNIATKFEILNLCV